MLFNLENVEIKEIPSRRKAFLQKGKDELGSAYLQAAEAYLDNKVDQLSPSAAGKITVSLPFIVPHDFIGTPLDLVWRLAGKMDFDITRLWLGVLFMEIMIKRDDEWTFVKSQFAGRDVEQAVYFRR